MEFSKVQKRFINQKSTGYQLLKGKKGTGKSTSSVYRAINLENNYCIYEEDRIIIVTSNYSKTSDALKLYNEENNRDYFYSLFSLDKERVTVSTLEKLISTYSTAYKRKNGLKLVNINTEYKLELGIEILNSLEEKLKVYAKKSKLIKNAKKELLLDEILWIKASDFTKEEYLDVERKGRKGRIIRNSLTREYIYELKELYNIELRNKGYMDKYDHVLFSRLYANKNNIEYTHVIIDDCERLTKGEIEFIKSIYSNKAHSSLIFIVNSELHSEEYSWLVKGRKLKTLGADFKGKTFSYKTVFNGEKIVNIETVNKYKYVNLKNKRQFDFKVDTASTIRELFLEDNVTFNNEELIDVPIFNEIAAGSPIEIVDNVEDKFYIPTQWIGKNKDNFILKVKGDSMVDKDICDGDLVVIRKQSTANHNDIVAANLDGEATLKTLNINGESPMLMPANSLYSPIPLEGENNSILGVAIGVIKK